ncbi:MAG: hypothetical protein CMK08_16400 [Ponticaulis sp.]|nr:hypothetical protein [Ponticaulis sp.]MBN04113.1 hypothetical protein [Ponticaulis sp.]MBN05745.1 hypothetical protein [Ponticaulis sp.]
MEVMLKSSLASMPDAGSAVHYELADHLGMISSLQASMSAGIAISPASLQLAINRVQQETLQLALKKSDQQTIAAVLAEQMLQAEEARLSREASDFRLYEREASSRIQSLAEVSGIDISAYEQNRSDILASRKAAQASGDIVEEYKQDALLAANNRHGMALVHAPEEEQERARKEEEAAKERYLRQVEIMAMREAQRMGLSGEQATEYVVSQRAEAEAELQQELEERSIEAPSAVAGWATERELTNLEITNVREQRSRAEQPMDQVSSDALAIVEGIVEQNFDLSFLEATDTPERSESTCPSRPVAKDEALSPC